MIFSRFQITTCTVASFFFLRSLSTRTTWPMPWQEYGQGSSVSFVLFGYNLRRRLRWARPSGTWSTKACTSTWNRPFWPWYPRSTTIWGNGSLRLCAIPAAPLRCRSRGCCSGSSVRSTVPFVGVRWPSKGYQCILNATVTSMKCRRKGRSYGFA